MRVLIPYQQGSLFRLILGANTENCMRLNPLSAGKSVQTWTEHGIKSGGTASAITLCERNNIPVFNLGVDDPQITLDALNAYFGF